MKTAKLVIGIISIVLFIIIMFQSCAVGVVNTLQSNSDDVSGSAGMLLAFAMLIAGIIGITARKSKGGGITAGVFYVIAALIGLANLGTYGDLVVWSVVSLGFGIVFIFGSLKMKQVEKTDKTNSID